MRQLIKRHRLYEVKTIGDSFMCAVEDPQRALAFIQDEPITNSTRDHNESCPFCVDIIIQAPCDVTFPLFSPEEEGSFHVRYFSVHFGTQIK